MSLSRKRNGEKGGWREKGEKKKKKDGRAKKKRSMTKLMEKSLLDDEQAGFKKNQLFLAGELGFFSFLFLFFFFFLLLFPFCFLSQTIIFFFSFSFSFSFFFMNQGYWKRLLGRELLVK